ncbi:MAG TPA: hypothetical protein VGE63_00585 [Candidatus Paceibacterota bacterium]
MFIHDYIYVPFINIFIFYPWITYILIIIGSFLARLRNKKKNQQIDILYWVFTGIAAVSLIGLNLTFTSLSTGFFIAELVIAAVLLTIKFFFKKENFVVNYLLLIITIPAIISIIVIIMTLLHPPCMGCIDLPRVPLPI